MQRRHPRFELLASVELVVGVEVVILTVRNISIGGIFVLNDGHDLSTLGVGSIQELTLFTPADLDRELVVRGQVLRHDQDGIALAWGEDDMTAVKLAAILGGGPTSHT